MTDHMPASISPLLVQSLVRMALEEDLGRSGDITSQATIGPDKRASAVLSTRQPGVVSGLLLARAAFQTLDPQTEVRLDVEDGDAIETGQAIAHIAGNARAILSAERVALNFLMHLSGIATLTSTFAQQIAGSGATICCTRKTIPGLRAAEKYAVRCGGGSNHRFGLDDAILIKDNHIAVAGSVSGAIAAAKSFCGHLVKIEVEVDTLAQFEEALAASPDVVLLDNMTLADLREAVRINQGALKLEASGNVDLSTVAAIAGTGVDYISTSKITLAAPPLDLGLDIAVDGG